MPRAYWSASNSSRVTSSTDTWANAASITFTPVNGTSYLCLYSLARDVDSRNYIVRTALRESTTNLVQRTSRVPYTADVTVTHRDVVAYVYTAADSSSHTFNVAYQVDTAGVGNVTIGVDDCQFIIMELLTNDKFGQNTNNNTTTSTTYGTRTSCTLASGTRDYLCMFSATVRGTAGTSPYADIRGLASSTPFSEYSPGLDAGATQANGTSFFGAYKFAASGGETVAVQYRANGSGDTAGIDSACIVCLAMDSFTETFAQETRAAGTTTSATFADRVSLTATLVSTDYLVIETGIISATTASGNPRVIARSLYDGTQPMPDAYRAASTTVEFDEVFGRVQLLSASSGSHTFKIQWAAESGATGTIADAGIYLLRLGTAPLTLEGSISETISLSDSPSSVSVQPAQIDELLSISDSLTTQPIFAASISETLTITDDARPPGFNQIRRDGDGNIVYDGSGNPIVDFIYGYEASIDFTIDLTDTPTNIETAVALLDEQLIIADLVGADNELTPAIRTQVPWGSAAFGTAPWAGLTLPPAPVLETVTLQYATEGLDLGGVWVPGVLQPFDLEQSLRGNGGLDALPVITVADLSLANADGSLDTLADDYLLEGRRIRISVAEVTDGVAPLESDFAVVASGVIDRVRYRDADIALEIRDAWARLQQPVQAEYYIGTGDIDGGPELEGLSRPLCFGRCNNVPGTLIDGARLIYQIHRGDMRAIYTIYDAGVPIRIAKLVDDYESLRALVPQSSADPDDTTPYDLPLGTAAVCLKEGCFRLAGLPIGAVTADCQGSGTWINRNEPWLDGTLWSDGTGWEGDVTGRQYLETAGSLILQLMVEFGPFLPTEVDGDGFFQVDTETPRICGLHFPTGGTSTLATAIGALCASVGIVIEFASTGLYRPRRITTPSGTGTITITDEMIERGSLRRVDLPWGRGAARQRIRYDYNNRVMTDAEIAGSVQGDLRIAFTKAWSELERADRDLLVLYPDLPAVSTDTALTIRDDALAEANRRLALYRPDRRAFELSITNAAFRLELGTTITLQTSRYGMQAGRQMIVSRIRETSKRPVTELTVWG